MKKKRQEKRPRQPSRRQLARWEQEKRRQRIIFGLAVLVIISVVAIVGVGFFTSSYGPLHQTVLVVNGTRFSMAYYLDILKYYGRNQNPENLQIIASQVPETIQRIELVRQGALALDIEVSNDEVDQELAKIKPPLGKEYRDLVRHDLLMKRLVDEQFDQTVPKTANQRQILAMFLESESQALDVRSQVESGKSFNDLAAQLSLDPLSKEKKGNIGWQTKEILALRSWSTVLTDYAFGLDVGTLSQPILDEAKTKNRGYWIVKILERRQPDVDTHILGMLLSGEEQAKSIRARLEAGEDFAALAGEFSQLDSAKDNGGDLGWALPGTVGAVLEDFIFKSGAEPGTISPPIRDEKSTTRGGNWLIKVSAQEDNRKIDDEDRQILKNKAANEWVETLRADPANKIENFLDSDKISWAVNRLLSGSRK